MFVKEVILICYLLCIIIGVSSLTIALITKNKNKSEMSRSMVFFLIGMLVICCYDMAIYYGDYVIGVLTDMKVLRIGNCIIAGTMYLWTMLQSHIIERDALSMLDKMVRRYLLFYMTMWLLLTLFLSIEQFYALKWLLLATDVIVIIAYMASAVGHVIYAAVAENKRALYYMVTVTAMIVWNYISYFWGETSVYWGNSRFIREPLDLTVIFWLIICTATLVYEYKEDFVPAFIKPAEEGRKKKDIRERIDIVCEQYKLTPREKEFIEQIYSGKTNKEIAEILFLSESTVKTHIYNIFRKMNVKNRVEIICILNEEDL